METNIKSLFAFTLFLASLAVPAYGSDNPVILLYERDPWRMVVGSDSPTFALYDDGRAIYWDEKIKEHGGYQIATLTKKEAEDLFTTNLKKLENLNNNYELANATDQPTQEFYFETNGSSKSISVYGNLRRDDDVRNKAPEEILAVFDYLTNYTSKSSKEWLPSHLEVMIWPYEYAPDESIVWPKEWPDINSSSTRKRRDAYSIYLPIEQKAKFIEFMKTRKEKGAVLINGKKWAVATRIPFPHEMALNKTLSRDR